EAPDPLDADTRVGAGRAVAVCARPREPSRSGAGERRQPAAVEPLPIRVVAACDLARTPATIRQATAVPARAIPFPPMEAELVRELPAGDGWQYEPKWDGFRGVLENVGKELALWSRKGRPLLRYFPELRPLGDLLPPHSALDGEIVIERDGRLDFDSMQMRLHPAESRVRKLAAEIPAQFVAFDVLLWEKNPTHALPLEERRAALEQLPFTISPATSDAKQAEAWLSQLEATGLDGVIAKRL